MEYTKKDYEVLQQSLSLMKELDKYFNNLIVKTILDTQSFGKPKDKVMDALYVIINEQKQFDITNYSENCYIDISCDNLVFSIYTNDDCVYFGEEFEIWNDSECYCIGTLSIKQIEKLLKEVE